MKSVKMSALIAQIRGVSYKPEDLHADLDDSSIVLLRANNIDEGKINFEDVVFVDKKKVSQEQLLKRGDILICASSGSKNLVGKAATVDFDGEVTFGAFCKVIRPLRNEDADYISTYFQSPIYRREISAAAIGVNINNIRNEHIDTLSVRWPAPEIRHKAVEILKNLHSLICMRRQQLSALDDLIKARFVEMFGTVDNNVFNYPVVRLGKYAKLQGGYAFKSKDFVDNGVPLVQIGNVNKDYLDWEVINAVPNEYLEKYSEFSLRDGDLVMAMTRPIIKSLNSVKIAKVSKSDVPSLLNQRVGRFVMSGSLNREFLETLCKSNDFKDYVERMSGNSLQPNISSKQVEDYMIILPPTDLQEQFAEFVKQVDKSKVVVQKALDEAQVLFDSLMQKYFG